MLMAASTEATENKVRFLEVGLLQLKLDLRPKTRTTGYSFSAL